VIVSDTAGIRVYEAGGPDRFKSVWLPFGGKNTENWTLIFNHDEVLHLDGPEKPGFQTALDCQCDLRNLRGRP